MNRAILLNRVAEDYPDYLRDESRRMGRAESISFPRSEDELRRHLAEARRCGRTVTIQGARTGVTGGAVPDGGHILNLSRMDAITALRQAPSGPDYFLTVQPGVLLSSIAQTLALKTFPTDPGAAEARQARDAFLAGGALFFPPDPTETSATIGGMASNNASGARSYRYGATRDYIHALRVVLADGSTLALVRGGARAVGRRFSLMTEEGRPIPGLLPLYEMPAVKNAAGYFARDNMDLIDLFIGAEGTLGVISELTLRLVPAPAVCWGATVFLPDEEAALAFVERLRQRSHRAAAVEFFSSQTLDLLRRHAADAASGEIPPLPPEWHTAVYVEYHGGDENETEAAVAELAEALDACGGHSDATWLATNEHDMRSMKAFRHAVPESVNREIDVRRRNEPKLTKLGTDLAVPDGALRDVIRLYHEGLARERLDYVIFGHIGNNHLHVNILPRDLDEYQRGRQLYLEWAHAVVAMGGTVSAEHGIGKLKTALLREMYGEDGVGQMRALKKRFDPDEAINPGTLFEGAFP